MNEKLRKRLEEKSQTNEINSMENKYWNQIILLQAQSDGLLLGFNTKNETKMTMGDLYLLNADGEIAELLSLMKSPNYFDENANYRYKINNHHQNHKIKKSFIQKLFHKYKTKDLEKLWKLIEIDSHCSAFVKLIKDGNNKIQNVLVSHSTWDHYSEMLRIYKE